jgi:hypothetical protein
MKEIIRGHSPPCCALKQEKMARWIGLDQQPGDLALVFSRRTTPESPRCRIVTRHDHDRHA